MSKDNGVYNRLFQIQKKRPYHLLVLRFLGTTPRFVPQSSHVFLVKLFSANVHLLQVQEVSAIEDEAGISSSGRVSTSVTAFSAVPFSPASAFVPPIFASEASNSSDAGVNDSSSFSSSRDNDSFSTASVDTVSPFPTVSSFPGLAGFSSAASSMSSFSPSSSVLTSLFSSSSPFSVSSHASSASSFSISSNANIACLSSSSCWRCWIRLQVTSSPNTNETESYPRMAARKTGS